MPNECDRQTYIMTPVTVEGVRITMYSSTDRTVPPNDRQRQIIIDTLRLIPSIHLRRVFGMPSESTYIQVSKPRCGPHSGGGNGAFIDQNWVKLSANSVNQGYNGRFNVTLLHEFGHLVNHAYSAMRWLRSNDREAFILLSNTRHEGSTQGAREAFADCYMIYVYTRIAGLGYTHRADPVAYRGDEAERRFRAMQSTPAFSQLSHQP